MNYRLPTSKKRAITLIEAIIDAGILSMISIIILTSLLSSLRTANLSSAISTGGQLANEKMEILRNLAYDALATQHGAIFPQGNIIDNEIITRDKKVFRVNTEIIYVDDPYDGLAPVDLNPADYKKVTLTVYDNASNKQLAVLSSNIASHAAETVSNTGVIRVTVLDANGKAVSGADVTITNTTIVPNLLINTSTDSNGIVLIPNLPVKSAYHVVATKTGFSTDSTTPGSNNPTPLNPDATVLLQKVATVTLNIDATSTIVLTAQGLNVPSITGQLKGSKLIGSNPNTIKTSLNLTITPTTTINNVEYDSYTVIPQNGWYVTTCDPMQPFPVNPGTSVPITCVFTQQSFPQVVSITPHTVTASAGVIINITGANFTAPVQVSIQQGASPEIALPGFVSGNGSTTLDGTIDFSTVPPGTYNVIIHTTLGDLVMLQTTQTNGLVVQ